MRELKFRAWNTIIKEWATSLKLKPNGHIEDINYDSEGFYYFEPEPDQYVIEQYTGLKDKNGKEVYEGDIVLAANHGRTPFVVIYREGDCSFLCNNELIKDYAHLFKAMPQCYEVIGNIHENPELLGKEE